MDENHPDHNKKNQGFDRCHPLFSIDPFNFCRRYMPNGKAL